MISINGYCLNEPLKNTESGFSKWGIAKKNDSLYFLKEFLRPVYPTDPNVMSFEQMQRQIAACEEFEKRKAHFYALLAQISRGDLVRIIDFFRVGGKYYIATPMIDAIYFSYIQNLSEENKIFFLATLTQCFVSLHEAGFVHLDVKPNNILAQETKNGNYCAKLIDFDDCRFVSEISASDEIGGDLAYLSPEVFLFNIGENDQINQKSDIFSLGLVFHECFCGSLPSFDRSQFTYLHEAVLENAPLSYSSRIPSSLLALIKSMLSLDPTNRPTAKETVIALKNSCALFQPTHQSYFSVPGADDLL